VGVFEFIVVIVLISTIGKAVSNRAPREPKVGDPQLSPGEIDRVRESLDDLSGRVGRLEEERDFYKQLLDVPPEQRGLPSPSGKDGSASD
jgi:hypothetical protein